MKKFDPEEHYGKNDVISDKAVDFCLVRAENFDHFVDLLEHYEVYLYIDDASDIWFDYINRQL